MELAALVARQAADVALQAFEEIRLSGRLFFHFLSRRHDRVGKSFGRLKKKTGGWGIKRPIVPVKTKKTCAFMYLKQSKRTVEQNYEPYPCVAPCCALRFILSVDNEDIF